MSAAVKEESISWVARRVVYLVGLVVGLVLVYSGRATQEQVDGLIPVVVEVGGYVVSLGFGLATWRTGPNSDNSTPVVVDGEAKVDMLLRNVEGLIDALQRVRVPSEPEPVPPPPPAPEPVPSPEEEKPPLTLEALRALIEQNRRR